MQKLFLIFSLVILSAFAQPARADVTTDKVQESIKNALAERGVEGKLDVDINGYNSGFNLRNEPEAYQVYVQSISVNQQNRLWNADVAFTTQDNKMEKFKVNGKYDQLISIPVLSQKLPQNSVIKEEDIAWLELPKRRIPFGVVMDAEQLIGQALKRPMRDMRPIKERDLQKEQVMFKNSNVNILYNTHSISLRTIGIALDDGGIGDIIKVRNSSSKKIIQAIIRDEGNVDAVMQGNSIIEQTAQIEGNSYVR